MATGPRSTAKEALVTHAERLVAERGLQGVAVSEVVRAAGQKNNSAVSYHFGSWDGLLDAVWQRHTAAIDQQRRELLAAARRDDTLDLPTLVRIYIAPIVSEMARNQPSYWARFNEQWLACTPLDVFEPGSMSIERQNTDVQGVTALSDVLEHMIGSLTQLSRRARSRRVALMTRFVIAALSAWERDTDSNQLTLDELAGELINLAIVLLRAPAAEEVGASLVTI